MNPNLIRGKMAEHGKTQKELAKIVGMSANSLSRKLGGKREFTLSEVMAICSALNIDNPVLYFFDEQSQKRNEK